MVIRGWVTLRECNETWFRKEESAKAVARPRKTRKKSGHSFGREGKAMIKAQNEGPKEKTRA